MKTTALSILFSMIFLVACKEEAIDRIGPVKDEQWFKNLQHPCEPDDVCKTSIARGGYDDYDVYFILAYGENCDVFGAARIYNENGDIVKEYDMTNEFEFYTDVPDYEIIWTCD